jgi:uncharacterized protein YacL
MAARQDSRRVASTRAFRAFLVPYFVIAAAAGGLLGHSLGRIFVSTDVVAAAWDPRLEPWVVYATTGIGVMALVLAAEMLLQIWVRLFRTVANASAFDRAAGAVGLSAGLVVGAAVCIPFSVTGLAAQASPFRAILMLGVLGLFGLVGMLVALGLRDELASLVATLGGTGQKRAADPVQVGSVADEERARPKLLDTNVIIDGRIASVLETGFIEGYLYVPAFILQELQHIADSEDPLRRRRGRRGLVMLSKMQKELSGSVAVLEDSDAVLPDTDEVDIRLVHLAKHMEATVVTNDFNLSRVAELHGVSVLNVNELASALKPVLMHGEEVEVTVVKLGREPGQGVAYLEDGTMVVIEDAAHVVGEEVVARVTSMIQTVAGKMVFAVLVTGES